ncbi:hypothetical protein ETU08_09840 [Apibacter muscae]|uniref:Uncharacterized protein n=1 Tax=Apibacter muscae TaxID=2509004 RepID=A0A563D7I7_9FLAO|nr:hypothetical protein [Apibacter muscae]TWP26165.1 hypothetical protein ETU09_10720 [Apibacter muscae]TWP28009.1 hypothetical protein ETU08_09840 [Apibacter muscae]
MKILHYLFNYKSTIFISLIVLIITILCLNIYPIKKEHSLIENAIFTGSIISPVIFLFITIGLFKGLFCKNTPTPSNKNYGLTVIPNNCLDKILYWILSSIILVAIYSTIDNHFHIAIFLFIIMLYWIFFKSLSIVLKNSLKCKKNLGLSMIYGLTYTLLFNLWFYTITFMMYRIK